MEIACPECRRTLQFKQAFDAAFCWGCGPDFAVAFRCPHCDSPAYFGPRLTFLDVGSLGAGPTLDPIPLDRYPLIVNTTRDDQYLTMEYNGTTRTIPSANLYARNRAA